MNYRIASVLQPEDIGASGTKVIDLNIKDPISRLEFIWKTTNVTVSVMTAPHLRCISKIELVDGSDVLFSLSGEEAAALNYYDRKEQLTDELSLTVGDIFVSTVGIDFGRKLWDSELALDPSKFRNLQLKVTWDEDAHNASVVVNSLEINAFTFDDKKISPRGFLMSKEVIQYTPTASGYEYVDLPTDHPIRKIVYRNKTTDKNPFEVLDQFKLSEENDKKIPLDVTGQELYRKTRAGLPRLEFKAIADAAVTAKTYYVVPTYDTAMHVNYDATAFVTAQSKFAVATVTNDKVALSASVDIQAVTVTYSGFCPYSTLYYPFGNQDDIADWYDVTKLKSLQLITQGNATIGTSPTAEVVLQQLRLY